MSDEFFQRYFRLNRPTFEWLVEEISPLLRLTDTGVKRAEASSGSSISVVILLAIPFLLELATIEGAEVT